MCQLDHGKSSRVKTLNKTALTWTTPRFINLEQKLAETFQGSSNKALWHFVLPPPPPCPQISSCLSQHQQEILYGCLPDKTATSSGVQLPLVLESSSRNMLKSLLFLSCVLSERRATSSLYIPGVLEQKVIHIYFNIMHTVIFHLHPVLFTLTYTESWKCSCFLEVLKSPLIGLNPSHSSLNCPKPPRYKWTWPSALGKG